MPRLRLVTPTHPAAAPLLAGLRHEYQTTYGPDVAAELDAYSEYEFFPPAGAFLVLESRGITLAGGALRRLEPGVGEIKRMWTAPSARGLGIARKVLRRLEEKAREVGVARLHLETNRTLAEAQALYRQEGYEEVAPFNSEPYAHHWFEKRL